MDCRFNGSRASSDGNEDIENRTGELSSSSSKEELVTGPTKSDNFPSKIHEQCLSVLDSTAGTSFMTFVTMYALYGDDIRILIVDASKDDVFTIFSSISFFLFLAEILVQCVCRQNYMRIANVGVLLSTLGRANTTRERLKALRTGMAIGSFYFWLDLLATVSMTLEIPWMALSPLQDNPGSNNNNLENARAGKASKAGAKAARILRIVRMVRLVRLVKLYKYVGGIGNQGNSRRSSSVAPQGNNDSTKPNPPDSHLGAEMSDRTTKKVILGILVMLIGIPLLQVSDLQYFHEFGMQLVYRRRAVLSQMVAEMSPESAIQDAAESWKSAEEYFLAVTNCLRIEYSGFHDGHRNTTVVLHETLDPDLLQQAEKSILVVTDGTANDQKEDNRDIEGEGTAVTSKVTAIFDTSDKARQEAIMGTLLTTFVILLLAIGTLILSRDVNILVIEPIEKMVQMVKEISANPLSRKLSTNLEDIKGMDDGLETTLLLRTISKIAGLMRIGFGEAGAEIIGRNLSSTTGAGKGGIPDTSISITGPVSPFGGKVNLLGTGTKINSIFAFCDVRNFTDTTECLQEEVMLFVNRIAHILHSIVVQCHGAANKNIGDAFLLTWKLADAPETGIFSSGCAREPHKDLSADKALYSLLKTMVEMNRHEDFICSFSPTALSALYERMPRYKCRIGCGLHVGWAIEGAIGSEKKIDASYISPHVNWSEFLEGATKDYGVPILLSQKFYNLLSPQSAVHCRQVDNIKKSATDREQTSIYSFDADLGQDFSVEPERARPRTRTQTARRSETSKKEYRRMISNRRSVKGAHRVSQRVSTARFPNDSQEQSSSLRNFALNNLGEMPKIVIPTITTAIWEEDSDMIALRSHISEDFRQVWKEAFKLYISGNWAGAADIFEQVLCLKNGGDGPAALLLERIRTHELIPPKDWAGFWTVG